MVTKRAFLGPQDHSGSSRQFLGQGDEVKVRPGEDRERVQGYVISIKQEGDRSLKYVIRTENDEVLTVEPARIVSVRSEATGEWNEV
jgi:hypothetical protein